MCSMWPVTTRLSASQVRGLQHGSGAASSALHHFCFALLVLADGVQRSLSRVNDPYTRLPFNLP